MLVIFKCSKWLWSLMTCKVICAGRLWEKHSSNLVHSSRVLYFRSARYDQYIVSCICCSFAYGSCATEKEANVAVMELHQILNNFQNFSLPEFLYFLRDTHYISSHTLSLYTLCVFKKDWHVLHFVLLSASICLRISLSLFIELREGHLHPTDEHPYHCVLICLTAGTWHGCL